MSEPVQAEEPGTVLIRTPPLTPLFSQYGQDPIQPSTTREFEGVAEGGRGVKVRWEDGERVVDPVMEGRTVVLEEWLVEKVTALVGKGRHKEPFETPAIPELALNPVNVLS